jgi:U1 small nuclear ribonucleoprotein
MTANLPPQLIKYFTPRPPLPFLPPTDKDFAQRKRPLPFGGIAPFLALAKGHDEDYVPSETAADKQKREVRSYSCQNMENSQRVRWKSEEREEGQGSG